MLGHTVVWTIVVSNREFTMQARMQLRPADAGQAIISLSVPATQASAVAEIIKGMLALTGLKVQEVNSEGDDVVSADDVFKEASPATALRGFRGKISGALFQHRYRGGEHGRGCGRAFIDGPCPVHPFLRLLRVPP